MNNYHAHIYFQANDLAKAEALAKQAEASELFSLIEIYPKPVGPHPTAMVELHFDRSRYDLTTNWVEAHRADLSVLIHLDTGNDVKDHTEGICWLGEKLTLDFSFFELILSRPELRLHP